MILKNIHLILISILRMIRQWIDLITQAIQYTYTFEKNCKPLAKIIRRQKFKFLRKIPNVYEESFEDFEISSEKA